MASSLFPTSQPTQAPQMGSNPMQMLQKFNQFRQQMMGKDPKAMVEQLLQSGKMTPQQFDQLKQQASMFQNFLK